MTVALPVMTPAQEQAWLCLLAMADRMAQGWCLVGGQMVHLHCAERGVAPNRPTDDGDAVLDVRARPDILAQFTRGLLELGFVSRGVSMEGHEHRWVNGAAQIDVLIPSSVGERGRARRGATGGTTLETPGAQQALNRTQLIDVQVAGRAGRIPRPDLRGALVMKAAAYSVTNDSYRERHLVDLAVLATLIRRADDFAGLTKRDRTHLAAALAAAHDRPELVAGIEGSERGLDVLRLVLERG